MTASLSLDREDANLLAFFSPLIEGAILWNARILNDTLPAWTRTLPSTKTLVELQEVAPKTDCLRHIVRLLTFEAISQTPITL